MTDSQNKLHQAMKILPVEREKLLVSYINMLAIDMDQAEHLKKYLLDFAQLLTDYSALGEFELVESIISAESKSGMEIGDLQPLLSKLQKTTDHYLKFIDRYENSEQTHELRELCEDLENLGESLAERFEIEDQLILGVAGTEL